MVPDGARQALARGVGRQGLEDLLLVPALVRPSGSPWRCRCQYSPPCVLDIGERGLGLWAQALPAPDVRVTLPLGAIAAVERGADGPRRQLIVAGPGGRLSVRYDASGDVPADNWVRRLRRHCAGRPEPLPAGSRTGRGPCPRDLRPLLIDGADDAVAAGPRALPWRGPCLLALTSREVCLMIPARMASPLAHEHPDGLRAPQFRCRGDGQVPVACGCR